MKKLWTKRFAVQATALLFLHSAWAWEAKWLCNPVLSCHSCALAWFACPVGVFVHYSSWQLFPLIALGTVLVVGVVLGRLLCGWVCPFGFLQDLLYRVPVKKRSLPKWTANIKYGVLILGVLALPLLFGEATSFCAVCPAAALQVSLPNFIGSGFAMPAPMTLVKFGVVTVVIVAAMAYSRFFCIVLCPIGAFLAPLNHVSYWVVGVRRDVCLECEKCDKACITGVQPSKRFLEGIPANRTLDCVVCHDCRKACT